MTLDADVLRGEVHCLLQQLLDGADFEGAAELRAQVSYTRVVGGTSSMLGLEVDPSASASSCPDGAAPLQGIAREPDGTPLGLVVPWVADGYLAALESAWVTEEPRRGASG